MKAKHLFLSLIAALAAVSCEETAPALATLMVGSNEAEFTAAGGSKTIKVESSVKWSAEVAPATSRAEAPEVISEASWITLEEGENELIIKAARNAGTAERTGSVFVTAGDKTATIGVVQSGSEVTISADRDSVKTNSAGIAQTIAITANIPWTLEASADWIGLDKEEGEGNGSFTVTIGPKETPSARTGSVAVYYGMIKKFEIGVRQEGFKVELTVSDESFNATEEAGSKTVTVTSNYAWTVTSSASWVTVAPDSGEAAATAQNVVISWQEAGGSERDAVVTMKSGDVTKTVAVHQDKAEAKPIVLDVVFTNGSKSNQPFTTNFISSVASSYNLGPKTYTLKETTYQFEIYSAYIGHLINTVNGCLLLAWDDGVYTKDIREEPFAYIKFPAIPEYKLAKVTIATSATAPNPSTLTYPAYITPTYGSTNAEAIAAAIGSTSNLGRTGLANPNVLTTTNPAANTAYYLFLPPQTGKTTGYQTMIMELHLEYQPQ